MSGTFPVYNALPALGFIDQGDGTLEFVHPQFELGAVEGYRPWPPEGIVSFAGQFKHGQEFGFLEFELPAAVESLDQLKAMLAYNLRHVMTSNAPEWILRGISFLHLVPQVQKEVSSRVEYEAQNAAYVARDRCAVRREWLKLALKDLAQALTTLQPQDAITFAFDGSMLTIDCGRRIIVQAEGSAWRDSHSIRAADLATVPKRLMRDPTEVSAYGDYLLIGNCGYDLAEVGATANQSASNVDQ